MGDFVTDTALEGGDGRYRIVLSEDWEAPFGPLGGYVAAIALRAMGVESPLSRPVSIHCQFLAVAAYQEMDVEVVTLRRGKRSHALQVRMLQEGRLIHAASGWVAEEGMSGFEHEYAEMPKVPSPSELAAYPELVEDFGEWAACWKTAIEGKPVVWNEEPGPPNWHTWMRLMKSGPLDDPFLDAARSLMWMDLMMWNAAYRPHMPWPLRYIAPNLDVSASFHGGSPTDDWLLCDSEAPVARNGIIGCSGRVWSPSGRLLASGNSSLFCRPNPMYEQQLEQKREWETRQSKS